ncbi:photosystem I reaction center subunit XI [Candidatus Cyanaurora vandensis]|uniref:photosystem I reaction center subunit XI n=2 Tax=Candidatus Cyanaurora vandensis TaxID=2714958 RepID=UPI00257CA0A7|nr:photosystem I reaction center subunit XI [Candidatus Cyanaurora vandensis]
MQSISRTTVYTDDPQSANLFTPINNSPLIKFFIGNLPINRPNLDPLLRGLEVGMAHGYWLFGPFTLLGPLRLTANRPADFLQLQVAAALVATIVLVLVCTLALSLYATVGPDDDTNFGGEGWSRFAGGWLIGGVGGAIFAAFLFLISPLLQTLILGLFPG